MAEHELIKEFIELHNSAKDLLEQGNCEEAAEKYKELLSVYERISRSSLEQVHKTIAYDQLVALRDEICSSNEKTDSGMRKSICIGALLVLLGGVVLFNPAIFGLTALTNLNSPPEWSGPDSFVVQGRTTIDLSKYFVDAENDLLSFVATSADGISVEVSRNIVTLTPLQGGAGQKQVTFVAYDGKNIARKTVSLELR